MNEPVIDNLFSAAAARSDVGRGCPRPSKRRSQRIRRSPAASWPTTAEPASEPWWRSAPEPSRFRPAAARPQLPAARLASTAYWRAPFSASDIGPPPFESGPAQNWRPSGQGEDEPNRTHADPSSPATGVAAANQYTPPKPAADKLDRRQIVDARPPGRVEERQPPAATTKAVFPPSRRVPRNRRPRIRKSRPLRAKKRWPLDRDLTASKEAIRDQGGGCQATAAKAAIDGKPATANSATSRRRPKRRSASDGQTQQPCRCHDGRSCRKRGHHYGRQQSRATDDLRVTVKQPMNAGPPAQINLSRSADR